MLAMKELVLLHVDDVETSRVEPSEYVRIEASFVEGAVPMNALAFAGTMLSVSGTGLVLLPLPLPQEATKQDEQSTKIAVCLVEFMQAPIDAVVSRCQAVKCGVFYQRSNSNRLSLLSEGGSRGLNNVVGRTLEIGGQAGRFLVFM
jgi:hypothetical protein